MQQLKKGDVVIMHPAQEWKRERIAEHGALWVVRAVRAVRGETGDSIALRSVATGKNITCYRSGLEKLEGAEQ